MKFETDLIHFGYMNKNNRIYSMNSYDWSDVIQRSQNGTLLGELNHPDNFDITVKRISHIIRDIEVYQDGVYGEVEILKTDKGIELQTLIDSGIKMVFRPRSAGKVDSNGNVTIEKLYTFDAIPASEDAFFNRNLFRLKKLEKIMKIIDDKRRNSEDSL